MDITFWGKVRSNWQSVQLNTIEAVVDLELFSNALLSDISSGNGNDEIAEKPLELSNDDDFWGGL
ncbi:hypothetical protein B4147_1087 [Bacillus wiedmannii]|uniref:Uncharacterized protein n=1 Tax=Bacillus wiedmannii TaxID=1890302 RepID=A0A0G8CPP1_9BACI|nr:hypothetical protein [Bacillus wiedmannii]KLA01420.1 hypothetical protein B4147_1087 [Bacillus wiedmannii]